MNYKKRYNKGGGTNPVKGDSSVSVDSQNQDVFQRNRDAQNQMMNTINAQNQALHVTNAMGEIEAKRNIVQQQQFQQQMMIMQARLQMMQQQNELLKTKIEKDDLINSARTIPTHNQRSIQSPKKRGGSTKYKQGGAKKKSRIVISQNMGGVMKHGGQCGLPGGRYSKKKR